MMSESPSKNRYSNSSPSEHALYSLLMAGCIDWPSNKLNTHNLKKIVRQIHTQAGPRHSSVITSKPTVNKLKNKKKRTGEKRIKSTEESIPQEKPFPNRLDSLFSNRMLIIQKSTISSFDAEYLKKKKPTEVVSTVKTPVSVLPTAQVRRPRNTVKRRQPSIPIKEAMRDREWFGKAREQILQDLHSALLKSNGLQLTKPEDTYVSFKCWVGGGNNSQLVRKILGTRPWLTQVRKSERFKANLVWTQWKDAKFITRLGKKNPSSPTHIENPDRFSIQCKTRFEASAHSYDWRQVSLKTLGYDHLTMSPSYASLSLTDFSCKDLQIYNKLEGNYHLANKKGLFYNLKGYYDALGKDVFQVLPLTFHVTSLTDSSFQEFKQYFNLMEDPGFWILKPGENTNRGKGISFCKGFSEILSEVKGNCAVKHTTILQQYISDPLLFHNRKFDIRCFTLITSYNGVLQAYFYSEGYIRTASSPFNLDDPSKFVHLTNDAVQQKSEDYGKYESANKLSYGDFQRYLDSQDRQVSFTECVVPQIKSIVADTVRATFRKLDPHKRMHCFEVFGYDFLLDSDMKPWLLEVNTNPCLELSSVQLARIIPAMLDNAFKIAVDPLFADPTKKNMEPLTENKFELLFSSAVDGPALEANELIQHINPLIEDDCDEEYNHNIVSDDEDSDYED